jgi:hypothetical protein
MRKTTFQRRLLTNRLARPAKGKFNIKRMSIAATAVFWSTLVHAQNTLPASGNVGIGTTSPTTELDVVGSLKLTGSIGIGIDPDDALPIQINRAMIGSVGIRFENTSAIGSSFSMLQMGQDINATGTKFVNFLYANSGVTPYGFYKPLGTTLVNNGTGGLNLATYDASGNGDIQFFTGPSAAAAPKMIINPAGNVGIGTTQPNSFRLAVEGKIGARGVRVTMQSPWPDYVFRPEYRLMSLEELRAFISANRHLPEMPTAEEVEKEGIDLGEMDAKLLKKIEELTLYVLELKKENDEIKERLKKCSEQ